MSLEITLRSSKTDLMLQEDAELTVTLLNASRTATIRVPVFGMGSAWPRYRVRAERTGEEWVFLNQGNNRPLAVKYENLPPGEAKVVTLYLRQCIRFPSGAGPYTISAECEWKDGQEIAKSAPVAFEIGAMGLARAKRSMRQEAYSRMFCVYWAEASAEGGPKAKLSIRRATVMNHIAPTITDIADLGFAAPGGGDFLLATFPNRGVAKNAWLVWLDGHTLGCRPVPYDGAASAKDVFIELPDVRIIPLASPLSPDFATIEAPLWLGDKEGRTGKIQLAQANAEGASRPAGDLILPGALAPSWTESALLADGTRRLYMAFAEKGAVRICSTSWTDPTELSPLVEHAKVEGKFAGAGICVLADDDVSGALLVRKEGVTDEVQAISWVHRATDESEATEAIPIAIDGADTIDRFAMRVNEQNTLYMAAKSGAHPWALSVDGEAFEPIPGPAAEANGYFDLILAKSGDIQFVYALPGLGLLFSDDRGNVPVPVI